jgi:predicted ATP-grasp superfamily ATP-dependent carboligase
MPSTSIGAVVIGGDYQGLGIIRSLGARNIPICVIDDEHSISRFSRHATHAITVPNLRDESQTVEAILEIGRRLNLKGWVLYPTRDETVAAFSRYRSQLAEFFRVPTPDWDTIKWAWDKRNTYRLANELGIPTPRTWYPRDFGDLAQIDGDFPVILKPAIKEHFVYATKAKAWRANSRSELQQLFQRLPPAVEPGEIMVQDLIPGGGEQQFAYCAFFKDGRAAGSMVVRRSRQHPPEFGRSSTFVETIDLPIVEEQSERFLRSINYYGLVELEYKLDLRDGQYKLLDVNGRTWGYHTLGSGAGVDFSRMLFADQIGDNVQTCRGRAGVTWMRFVTDVPTGILEILRGRQDLKAYIRSLIAFDVESVFSWHDPLPGIAELFLIPYLAVRRGL